MLATLPIADEIAVYPARSHRLPTGAPGRTSFAFALPCDAAGLRFLCRESFDLGRSRFDHPLGSRFEEMDALAFFDNVFVPWERVFLLGDPDRCNNMSRHTHQYLHSGHQVVTKNVVKLEFVLGLANLMQDTLGSGQQPQMLQMTAEIIEALETSEGPVAGGGGGGGLRPVGGVLSGGDAADDCAAFVHQDVPAHGGDTATDGLQQPDGAADGGQTCRGRWPGSWRRTWTPTRRRRRSGCALFRLAWDTCCSAFAQRQILYERFFQGDAYRNVVLLNGLYDKEPATEFAREFLLSEL